MIRVLAATPLNYSDGEAYRAILKGSVSLSWPVEGRFQVFALWLGAVPEEE
jgi:hypothetical protein